MRKLSLVLGLAMGIAQPAIGDTAKKFKVTVINLTKGQPITPPVAAVHAPGYEIFHLGEPASEGLAALATDGETSGLDGEFEMTRGVVRSATGMGAVRMIPHP